MSKPRIISIAPVVEYLKMTSGNSIPRQSATVYGLSASGNVYVYNRVENRWDRI